MALKCLNPAWKGDHGGAIKSSATRLLKENAQHSSASAYRRRQVVGRVPARIMRQDGRDIRLKCDI